VFRKTLLLALLLAGPVWGQRATIPTEVHVQKNVPEVIALTEFDGDAVDWFIIDPGLAVFDISKLLGPGVATRPDRILVFAPAEGRYRVRAITAKVKDGKAALSAPTYCTVVVGNPPPTPTPPGPVPPGPTPPGPTPPGPAPVVGKKAVLILYETAEPNKLKGDQLSMVAPYKELSDYLNAKCDPDSAGRKAWRIWDPHTVVTSETQFWRDAMAKFKDKPVPYLVVSNGKEGFEGPLPETKAELMTVLKKYLD
jgi:hypothetical protein